MHCALLLLLVVVVPLPQGVQRDKLHWGDSQLFVVDMYNGRAFPCDTLAKAAIDVKVTQHACNTLIH